MMAFTCNDIPRFAFGFYNPNHAAAMICAVMASRRGNRTSRATRDRAGVTVSREDRSYDKYGRLVEIASFGTSVKYRYDAKGRLSRQVVDGSPIDFAYTKYGQLAGKYLGGREKPDAAVEYEYSKSGQIVARTANGVRQTYEYDGRGQLLAVKENGVHVERYCYDKAGNMLKKTIRGKTTTFAFDGANQLVSSTTDGVTTQYAYDAAGRLVKEGDKTYRYGYLDKVLSVTEGERKYTYDYHVDGQLARADYGGNGAGCLVPGAGAETFEWDGLALIRRGDERFVNEPHIGGGNPLASSRGTTYFNDILGTTIGAKSGAKYTPAALTAFGEDLSAPGTKHQAPSTFFTGKPHVAGLGHAFLMRNYRASLAKWQTADPIGYPDGWNQLAYCGNEVIGAVDCYALWTVQVGWSSEAGASSGIVQTLGIAAGYSRANGFTFGFYSTSGTGAYVGVSASTGLELVISNARSIDELAGVGFQVNLEVNTETGQSIGVTGSIPTNIGDTGYYSFGVTWAVATPSPAPLEVHSYITYTAIISFCE